MTRAPFLNSWSESSGSWSGRTVDATKRFGYLASHCAAVALQRRQSSRSVFGSAHEVPCSTVLAVMTALSMPRASMSSSTASGRIMRMSSSRAPGRGSLTGLAPNPVKTVLLEDARNTCSSSMCTWKSMTIKSSADAELRDQLGVALVLRAHVSGELVGRHRLGEVDGERLEALA